LITACASTRRKNLVRVVVSSQNDHSQVLACASPRAWRQPPVSTGRAGTGSKPAVVDDDQGSDAGLFTN
jgi:hypothetical protein